MRIISEEIDLFKMFITKVYSEKSKLRDRFV